jgi:hypothetical protein
MGTLRKLAAIAHELVVGNAPQTATPLGTCPLSDGSGYRPDCNIGEFGHRRLSPL